MDGSQILVTASIGLVASILTAIVTHMLTRAQERRKHERDVAGKLAELSSTRREQTMIMAVQYGHSCFIVERPGEEQKERVFLPMGSRITIGRASFNHVVLDAPLVSEIHAALRAQGDNAYVEPLAPTHGLAVNGEPVERPRKLATGDVITVPGTEFRVTFVRLVS